MSVQILERFFVAEGSMRALFAEFIPNNGMGEVIEPAPAALCSLNRFRFSLRIRNIIF